MTGTRIADANGLWFNSYGYAAGRASIVLYNGTAFYGMTNIGGTIGGGCS